MKLLRLFRGSPGAEDPWECTATSVGYERVQPGSPYPPRRHPVDHHFNWDQGRDRLPINWSTSLRAKARLNRRCHRNATASRPTATTCSPASGTGTRPDPQTGWVEQWIERRGPAFDRARVAGLLRPERPVWRAKFPSELLQGFERCHALAQQRSAGVQSMLSTMGLHLLSVLPRAARRRRRAPRHIDQIIRQVKASGRVAITRGSASQLARELNVSYLLSGRPSKPKPGRARKQYQLQFV